MSLHFLSQFTVIHKKKKKIHRIHCFELSIGAYFSKYLIEPTVIQIMSVWNAYEVELI